MLDYWEINVMLDTAVITLKKYLGGLKQTKQEKNNNSKTRMDKNSRTENSITNTAREITHTELTIKCKQVNTFTTHQIKISTKLKQLFGNSKIRTLEYDLKILKQDFKATSKKLSCQ